LTGGYCMVIISDPPHLPALFNPVETCEDPTTTITIVCLSSFQMLELMKIQR
jgi:hypothetical protein